MTRKNLRSFIRIKTFLMLFLVLGIVLGSLSFLGNGVSVNSSGFLAVTSGVQASHIVDNGGWELPTPLQSPDSLTIQPSTKDTWISESAPTSNHGSADYFAVYSGAGYVHRILIEFDLLSIPEGATIVSASLDLYYYEYWGDDMVGHTLRMHRLRRADWEELQATWNIYKTGNNWSTAGAADTATDIDTTFQVDCVVPASPGWMSWDGPGMVDLVEDAIDNRSDILAVRLHDTQANSWRGARFYSNDYTGNPDLCPKLTIEYAANVPVVTTQAVSGTGNVSATGNGYIVDTAVGSCDKKGFVWDTESHGDPGNTAPADSDYFDGAVDYFVEASGTFYEGTFNNTLSVLTPSEFYYVRAYAHNTEGYSYGNQVSFSTIGSGISNTQVSADSDDCDAHLWIPGPTWTFSLSSTPACLVGTLSGFDGSKYGVGLRFTNVIVPQGAGIQDAYISLRASSNQTYTLLKSYIQGEDVDNALTFSDWDNYKNRRGLDGGSDITTTAMVAWDNIASWTEDTWYNSANISSIITEIVSRPSWESGNSIVIFWDDHDGRTSYPSDIFRAFYSHDYDPSLAPKLHIEYSSLPTVTTQNPSDIGPSTATGHGTIVNPGGADCSVRGFVWDNETHIDNPGNVAPADSAYYDAVEDYEVHDSGTFGLGEFTNSLTGLSTGRTYYVRAYAQNPNGYSYGSEVAFGTLGWLKDFSYRKEITISSATGAGTYYQKDLVVHSGSGSDIAESGSNPAEVYLNNNCRDYPFDIAFVDGSGIRVNQWLDPTDTGTPRTFTLKINDDLSSSDSTLYIYYGRVDSDLMPQDQLHALLTSREYWQEASTPVVPYDTFFPGGNVIHPFCVQDPVSEIYYLFHEVLDGPFSETVAYHICYSYASDIDGPWTPGNSGQPVLSPTGVPGDPDKRHIVQPIVFKKDATWHLYYSGHNGVEYGYICHATATEEDFPNTWTRDTENNPMLVLGLASLGTVWYDTDDLVYYLTCTNDVAPGGWGVQIYESDDGTNWTWVSEILHLYTEGDGWDAGWAGESDILKLGSGTSRRYYQVYAGAPVGEENRRAVGVAYSDTSDPTGNYTRLNLPIYTQVWYENTHRIPNPNPFFVGSEIYLFHQVSPYNTEPRSETAVTRGHYTPNSPEDVFLAFDAFNTGTENPDSNWTLDGVWHEEGNTMRSYTADTYDGTLAGWNPSTALNAKVKIRFKMTPGSNPSNWIGVQLRGILGSVFTTPSTPYIPGGYTAVITENSDLKLIGNSGLGAINLGTIDWSQSHELELGAYYSGSENTLRVWWDGELELGHTGDTSHTTAGYTQIVDWLPQSGGHTSIDYFYVRKWQPIEPLLGAAGPEENNYLASNNPGSYDFGNLYINTVASTTINHFTITNLGTGGIDIAVSATSLTGGANTWVLSNTATPGEDTCGLEVGLDDADDLFDVIVRRSAPYNELVNNLAGYASVDWGLQLIMPSTLTQYAGQQMSSTLTLICSAHD